MVWTVISIDEDDYGCEERMPGEPLTVIVTLECEDGRRCQLRVADSWLINQEIEEGDEWPQDPEEDEPWVESGDKQAQWMDNYLDALEEMKI